MFQEPALTQDDIVKLEVKAFVAHSNASLENIIINLTIAFNMVWNNPKATPQEMFAVLGTQGGKTFADSYKLQLLIKELKPDFEMLVPPLPYTIAEDGTVTITEPEPTQPEEPVDDPEPSV